MSAARGEAGRANAQLEAARRELASLTRSREETADARTEHERQRFAQGHLRQIGFAA